LPFLFYTVVRSGVYPRSTGIFAGDLLLLHPHLGSIEPVNPREAVIGPWPRLPRSSHVLKHPEYYRREDIREEVGFGRVALSKKHGWFASLTAS
jgi:hypothetical protein